MSIKDSGVTCPHCGKRVAERLHGAAEFQCPRCRRRFIASTTIATTTFVEAPVRGPAAEK
ncbi:MAG: hypothetical protein J7M19_06630 [Planctomycetes bacterium]|nr:hypothetical protein [Planctomycetota bacterium]